MLRVLHMGMTNCLCFRLRKIRTRRERETMSMSEHENGGKGENSQGRAKKRVRKYDGEACLTLNDIKIAWRIRQLRQESEGQKAGSRTEKLT